MQPSSSDPPPSLPLEDYPISHAAIGEVLAGLECHDVVEVPRFGTWPRGRCYQNVKDHCETSGGSPQLGWRLSWLPAVFIDAEHHTVWRDPSGALIDICEQETSLGITTFVPDDRYGFPKDWADVVQGRYLVLVDDPPVEDWIRARWDSYEADAVYCEAMRRLGYAWDEETHHWRGPNPIPSIAERLREEARVARVRLNDLQVSLSDRYCPGGDNGLIAGAERPELEDRVLHLLSAPVAVS